MATIATNLEPPAAANGTPNPDSPVPLDTIPISPADGSGGGDLDANGDAADGEESSSAGKREHGDDEQITVFHDADNFNVKHPLMHTWTLWFTKPSSGRVRSFMLGSSNWCLIIN